MNIARYKKLVSSSGIRSLGIYTFSNFFSKGVSFLLLFIYTNPKYITPSENGLLNLFSTSLLFLMPFLSMGIVFSTSTDFFKLDKKEFKDFFTSTFTMPVLVMLLSMVGLYIFRQPLKENFGFPVSFVWIIPAVTFFTFCHEQVLAIARSKGEPMVHLKTNISKTIIELGLSFVLVVFFAWHWQGRVAGILLAYVLITIYAFYYFISRGYLFGKIRMKYLKAELIYAIPIIAMQVSLFCMNSSDKFFLSHFTNDNNSSVGIYGVACLFGSIILLISNAMVQYFFPKIFSILAEKEVDYASIKKQFIFFAGLMIAGTVAVFIFIFVIYHYFLNEKYTGAFSYIYFICSGYLIWCLTYFFYSILLYHKQKKKLLLMSLGNIIISLVCNYFFISNWGAYGAAVALLVTYMLVLIFTLLMNAVYIKSIFTHHPVSKELI